MARAAFALGLAAACAWPPCGAADVCAAPGSCLAADDTPQAGVELLQHGAERSRRGRAELEAGASAQTRRQRRQRDLAFLHVPYNFGHTVERVALLGANSSFSEYSSAALLSDATFIPEQVRQERLTKKMVSGGELWGRMYPAMAAVNNVTGCKNVFTPPKYWPEELAREYVGNKTTFGMLRDPYERLVALFRGSLGDDYGGDYSRFYPTCDVNAAVRQMMLDVKAGGKFDHECTYVPQAEYFEGEYGIKLAVDNRLFPDSFNKVMKEHGYDAIQVADNDVMHVGNCNDSWSWQLDCETRALVQEVYAADFKLICEKFGYCDLNDNTCIHGVAQMCPQKATEGLKSNC